MKKMRMFAALLITLLILASMSAAAYAETGEAEPATLAASLSERPIKEVKPELTKAASYNYEKIKLTWEPVAGADGYAIYRATSKSGKYTLVTSKVAPEKTTYINGGRTTGKTYYYKIRAYKLSAGKKIYSKYSAIKSAYARPNKAVITSLTSGGNIFRTFDLTWNKVTGATGYQIYMREKGTGTYKFQGNFKGTNGSVDLPVESKEYDLKVRAYKLVNGKKVYGLFSEVKNFEFTWTGADLKKAAEDFVIKEYGSTIKEYVFDEKKTPENSSWSACWPKHYTLYQPWEEVKVELERAIIADMNFYGEPLNLICFYLSPTASTNWESIYMLN